METQSKKINIKKVVQYVVILLIALALIYYSFRGVDWGEFWNGLAGCNWLWVILSMGIGVLEFVIRALRWHLLLKHIHPESKALNAYRGVTIGNIANFALPRVGEIVRCTVVSTSDRVPFEGAVGTVVVERAWDLVCLLLLTFSMFFFQGKFGDFIKEHFGGFSISQHTLGVIAGIIAGVVLLLIGYSIARSRKKRKSAQQAAVQQNAEAAAQQNTEAAVQQNATEAADSQPKTFWQKAKGFLVRFKEGLLSAFKMKHKWYFFLLTVLLWGSFWVTSLFTIWAFPNVAGDFTGLDALFLMVVGSLAWAMPVQGGIGTYHFFVSTALMQVYAMSQSESLAFATISHSSQTVTMIILGIISVIGYSIQKRKILKS